MLRSLYASISGLRNHQTRMDTIGNNIANVNTVGYKSSRVTFFEIDTGSQWNSNIASVSAESSNLVRRTASCSRNPISLLMRCTKAASR